MTIRFRTIFLILAAASLFCVLTPPILGLGSTALSYSGKCYGFTDGVWDCPWMEYARNEIFWTSMFLFVPALVLAAGWLAALGLWAFLRRAPGRNGLLLWQAALIPILACLGGGFLVFITSFIRR